MNYAWSGAEVKRNDRKSIGEYGDERMYRSSFEPWQCLCRYGIFVAADDDHMAILAKNQMQRSLHWRWFRGRVRHNEDD